MVTSGNKPLGVVIPTRWEAGAILRRFGFKRLGPALYTSCISNVPVFLCLSGVGRQAAGRAAECLVAQGAKALVSMGFCGALVPALAVGDLVTGRIVTVDKPVQTPEERRQLAARTSAVAADMETQAIIETGTRRGVPIRVMRIVSDGVGDDLTPLFGSRAAFSPVFLFLRLLNPRLWPLARRLYRQSAIAKTRLAEALLQACAKSPRS